MSSAVCSSRLFSGSESWSSTSSWLYARRRCLYAAFCGCVPLLVSSSLRTLTAVCGSCFWRSSCIRGRMLLMYEAYVFLVLGSRLSPFFVLAVWSCCATCLVIISVSPYVLFCVALFFSFL